MSTTKTPTKAAEQPSRSSAAAEYVQDLDELYFLSLRQRHLASMVGSHMKNGRLSVGKESEAKVEHSSAWKQQTQMWIYKQDPSVEEIGLRPVCIPRVVKAGPSDPDIAVLSDPLVASFFPIQPDKHGDFHHHPHSKDPAMSNPLAHDLVQVYTVVRMCLDMYLRALVRIDRRFTKDWRWQWDLAAGPSERRTPLSIMAHAGEKANALYLRKKKMLKFFYVTDTTTNKRTFLCRSLDVVAHETGHAILDAIKPSLYDAKNGQAGALHEAFGDLTAIFLILSQLDMCEAAVAEFQGDLRKAKWLSAIGEEFGELMNDGGGGDGDGSDSEQEVIGMRDANNPLKGSDINAPHLIHELSALFTGYIYDVLEAAYKTEQDWARWSDAEALLVAARNVFQILLIAFYNVGPMPDYCTISKAMEAAVPIVVHNDANVTEYQTSIAKLRDQRELAVAGFEASGRGESEW